MSNGAIATSSPQPLRIWAVDVSQWPTQQSSKEALRPLLDDFFEPKAPPAAAAGVGAAASASTSTSKAKPSTDKETDDSQRVLRYVREIDRTRSLAALLLPRIAILSMIKQGEVRTQSSATPADVSWHDLSFDRSREGRPYLSHPSLSHHSLDFNISHDGDWVVMALRVDSSSSSSATKAASEPIGAPASGSSSSPSPSPPSMRVGIDVMSLLLPHFESSPSTFLDTMQDSVTPSEAEWVRAALNSEHSDEGLERLYDLWTYKEALTKNLGLGLGFDFKRVELAFWDCEPEMRGKRRSSGVLSMDGKMAPQYVFTEIGLPSGEGNVSAEARRKGSKMVVCEGPYEESDGDGGGRQQISPSKPHTEAVQRGLLRMWTMQELVDEGRRLCKGGVSEATARGEN